MDGIKPVLSFSKCANFNYFRVFQSPPRCGNLQCPLTLSCAVLGFHKETLAHPNMHSLLEKTMTGFAGIRVLELAGSVLEKYKNILGWVKEHNLEKSR